MLAPEDMAYQRGVTYLMRTQLEDGSWRVRTRSSPFQPLKDSGFPHGRDQWISAAGTSWASLALALTQPKVPQHARTQTTTVASSTKK
jgi:N-acyl-D-amino-acid deacylase